MPWNFKGFTMAKISAQLSLLNVESRSRSHDLAFDLAFYTTKAGESHTVSWRSRSQMTAGKPKEFQLRIQWLQWLQWLQASGASGCVNWSIFPKIGPPASSKLSLEAEPKERTIQGNEQQNKHTFSGSLAPPWAHPTNPTTSYTTSSFSSKHQYFAKAKEQLSMDEACHRYDIFGITHFGMSMFFVAQNHHM